MRDLSVRQSGNMGRGVFAERDFSKDELIERCPVLVLAADQRPLIIKTILAGYFFNWRSGSKVVAIALGYGSLYNHSRQPNAFYEQWLEKNQMDIVALRPIRRDEEIFINYGGTPDDSFRWWFETSEDLPGG